MSRLVPHLRNFTRAVTAIDLCKSAFCDLRLVNSKLWINPSFLSASQQRAKTMSSFIRCRELYASTTLTVQVQEVLNELKESYSNCAWLLQWKFQLDSCSFISHSHIKFRLESMLNKNCIHSKTARSWQRFYENCCNLFYRNSRALEI